MILVIEICRLAPDIKPACKDSLGGKPLSYRPFHSVPNFFEIEPNILALHLLNILPNPYVMLFTICGNLRKTVLLINIRRSDIF